MEDPPIPGLFIYLLILSLTVGECVSARAAIARVSASAAIDVIITCVSIDCVVVRAASEGIITSPTAHGIAPDVSGNVVRPLLAEQHIDTVPAAQNVVACAATDTVVAGKAIGLISTTQKSNEVVVCGAIFRIVSGSTLNRRRLSIAHVRSLSSRRIDDESCHEDRRRTGDYCSGNSDGYPEQPWSSESDVPVSYLTHMFSLPINVLK
jgi:hypothetical protein